MAYSTGGASVFFYCFFTIFLKFSGSNGFGIRVKLAHQWPLGMRHEDYREGHQLCEGIKARRRQKRKGKTTDVAADK